MKAILHIGMPKTGSSFLQELHWRVRLELLENSILWPRGIPPAESRHHILYPLVSSHRLQPSVFRNLDAAELAEQKSLWVVEMERLLIKTNVDRVIFSSETLFDLGHRDPQAISRLKKLLFDLGFDEVQLVVFVRDFASHYRSLISQSIQGGWFPKHPCAALTARSISAWATVFGDSAISVLMMSRDRDMFAIAREFWSACDLGFMERILENRAEKLEILDIKAGLCGNAIWAQLHPEGKSWAPSCEGSGAPSADHLRCDCDPLRFSTLCLTAAAAEQALLNRILTGADWTRLAEVTECPATFFNFEKEAEVLSPYKLSAVAEPPQL